MAVIELFPAIDVAGGKLARLMPGGQLRTYDEDPLDAARRLASAGSRWIHLVDLDPLLSGAPREFGLLEEVARVPGLRVQVGGGLDAEAVAGALAHGATRAILGPRALLGPEGAVEAVIRQHGKAVGVGLDVSQGRVAPRGTSLVGPPVGEALATLAGLQPAFVVHTDIDRDGAMAGPDLDALAEVARAVGVPVVASGGVRGVADLRALARTAGVEGAIVGRAFHEGALTFREALAAVGAP